MLEHLFGLFINNAYAQAAGPGAPGQGGGLSFVVLFLFFILFIYFAIWRPQSKRAKEQRNLLDSLTKGDEVVTAGGLLGRVNKISGQYVILSVGAEVDVVLQKSSIVSIMPKGTLKTIE